MVSLTEKKKEKREKRKGERDMKEHKKDQVAVGVALLAVILMNAFLPTEIAGPLFVISPVVAAIVFYAMRNYLPKIFRLLNHLV